ncbi:ribonuclease H-like domain-containing protein [Tanacetum coccineum]
MNTLSEETPRVKSSGSAGGKNRQISIGIKTSGKSSGEEVNSVPNYLRASTGSCHDICKYGKRHEHVKSAIPIKFQRTTVVDKEKVAKTTVFPIDKNEELVNPPVCNESEPFSWDDIGEEESFITYTVNERSELIPDEEPLEESLIAPLVVESSHASSDKEESLIAPPVSECTEDEGVLEDESEYTDDHNEEVEVSEDESKSSDKEKEVSAAQNDEMDTPSEETPRVKSAILPSMELVNPSVCNEFEPFSWYDIGEEESFIWYTVNERSELIPDEELPENSTIMPTVIESSHASSDKKVSEESLIALPVSESTQDEGVLEDESKNEKEVAAPQNDEMENTAGVQDNVRRKGSGVISEDKDDKGVKLKFRRGKVLDIQSEYNDSKNGRISVVLKHRQGEQEKKDAHGLLNNIIVETASNLAESRKSKVKALVGAFETVIYLSKTANPLPRLGMWQHVKRHNRTPDKLQQRSLSVIFGRIDLEETMIWRNVELDDEDILPSENTSEHPIEEESLAPIVSQEEDVVPIHRSVRTHKAPDRLCLNVEIDPDRLSGVFSRI